MALLLGRKLALPQQDQLAAAEAADFELHMETPPDTQELGLCAVALSELYLTTHLPMNKFCDICLAGKLKQKLARRRRCSEMVEKQE
eukprot:13599322-Heterocapsa_arctica.AAC.1